MRLRDKLGWPVERVTGRPIQNTIRLLLHTDIEQTWTWRSGHYSRSCKRCGEYPGHAEGCEVQDYDVRSPSENVEPQPDAKPPVNYPIEWQISDNDS